jgi:transcriptional regulator with XRE-family HTH domain
MYSGQDLLTPKTAAGSFVAMIVGRRLGEFLRTLRTERKLTQNQCAKQIKVSRLTWMGWERGVVPAAVNLLDLAAWSGRTVDELVRLCCDQPSDESAGGA